MPHRGRSTAVDNVAMSRYIDYTFDDRPGGSQAMLQLQPTSFLFLIPPLALLAALLVSAVRALRGSVSRRWVEEFAKLHRLEVTPGNGNQIIAYRATTRRWRTTGLLLGVVVQI